MLRKKASRLVRANIALERNALLSRNGAEQLFNDEAREEPMVNRFASLKPGNLASTIQSPYLIHHIRDECLPSMNLTNNSSDWNQNLMPETKAGAYQQEDTEKSETECPHVLENSKLVSGAYVGEVLWEGGSEAESDSIILFHSNSPKTILNSSDSSPAKLPQPPFLPTTAQKSSSVYSSSSSQPQKTILRDGMLPDSILLRKAMEKMRSRARDPRFGPTIPLNKEEKYKAQQLFCMDVEDNVGQTALAWSHWVTNHVATRTCVAKSIRDAIIRFALPENLQELEMLDVIQYLEKFCFINNERMVLYEALYSKMRQVEFSLASLRETALRLIPQQFESDVDDLISLLDLPVNSSLGCDAVCKFLGLCERLFIQVAGADTDSGSGLSQEEADKWKLQADPLERLDFRYLNERITGINLNPLLKTLLETLATRTSTQFRDFPVVRTLRSEPEMPKKFEKSSRAQLLQRELITFKFLHH